jgi:hypothetical protein
MSKAMPLSLPLLADCRTIPMLFGPSLSILLLSFLILISETSCYHLSKHHCFKMPRTSADSPLGKQARGHDSESLDQPLAKMVSLERLEPVFIDSSLNISLDHYFVPVHYKDTLDCLLIPHGTILSRVEKLAMDITADYRGQTIYLLCVLKGQRFFLIPYSFFIIILSIV